MAGPDRRLRVQGPLLLFFLHWGAGTGCGVLLLADPGGPKKRQYAANQVHPLHRRRLGGSSLLAEPLANGASRVAPPQLWIYTALAAKGFRTRFELLPTAAAAESPFGVKTADRARCTLACLKRHGEATRAVHHVAGRHPADRWGLCPAALQRAACCPQPRPVLRRLLVFLGGGQHHLRRPHLLRRSETLKRKIAYRASISPTWASC